MTLKQMRKLDRLVTEFLKEYHPDIPATNPMSMLIATEMLKREQSPEGQAELLREKMDECPIE